MYRPFSANGSFSTWINTPSTFSDDFSCSTENFLQVSVASPMHSGAPSPLESGDLFIAELGVEEFFVNITEFFDDEIVSTNSKIFPFDMAQSSKAKTSTDFIEYLKAFQQRFVIQPQVYLRVYVSIQRILSSVILSKSELLLLLTGLFIIYLLDDLESERYNTVVNIIASLSKIKRSCITSAVIFLSQSYDLSVDRSAMDAFQENFSSEFFSCVFY
ncbi:hypothetical protein PCE1_002697 [Barthelona sp. PCE]